MVDIQRIHLSVEEFEHLVQQPEYRGRHLEYIGKEMVEVVSYDKATTIAARIMILVGAYIMQKKLEFHVSGANGGYEVGDERYMPDVGFISKTKYPELTGAAWIPHAPDLAVEVLSPSNTAREMAIKVTNYLAAGTLLWVVDPEDKTVSVHQTGQPALLLSGKAELTGGDLLPGFSTAINTIFG